MRRVLLVTIALLPVAGLVASCVPEPDGIVVHRKAMRKKHNRKRANFGIAKLKKDAYANTNAQIAANRISGESGGGCLLRHTSPSQLLSWYNARTAENIACQWGCIDSGGAFKQFWQHAAHRANILDPGFHRIGIGIQCNGPMSYFAIHFIS